MNKPTGEVQPPPKKRRYITDDQDDLFDFMEVMKAPTTSISVEVNGFLIQPAMQKSLQWPNAILEMLTQPFSHSGWIGHLPLSIPASSATIGRLFSIAENVLHP